MPTAARPEVATGWIALPFGECVTAEGIERKSSIQQTAYQSTGRFPVVDQGATFIAGYTDEESLVHQRDLPLILFGDHTRAFKFLDFPFATGADGTKLLRANEQLVVPRFLYYALRHLDIPSRGYARHFGYLRDVTIAAPTDREEQLRIAAVVSRLERRLIFQDRLVTSLRDLKAATMAQLLREGLRGEPLKPTDIGKVPESWPVVPFSDAVSIVEGLVDPIVEPYSSMTHVGPDNVEPGTGRLLKCVRAKDLGLISGKYLFRSGDIVYSKIRPYLRKSILADFTGLCSADMYPLTVRKGFDSAFLHAFTLSEPFTRQAVSQQDRTGIPKLNREQVHRILVPRPSLEEQAAVGNMAACLHERLALAVRRQEILKSLFNSMLHLLVTGQVRVPPDRIERLGARPREGHGNSARGGQLGAGGQHGTPDEAVLQEIVRRIVEAVAPEKIILFGSAARGQMGPDSDLDLLVVKACDSRREVAVTIYRRLRGIGVPTDVVVVTPEDVARDRDTIGYILRPALREGRVLYAV